MGKFIGHTVTRLKDEPNGFFYGGDTEFPDQPCPIGFGIDNFVHRMAGKEILEFWITIDQAVALYSASGIASESPIRKGNSDLSS